MEASGIQQLANGIQKIKATKTTLEKKETVQKSAVEGPAVTEMPAAAGENNNNSRQEDEQLIKDLETPQKESAEEYESDSSLVRGEELPEAPKESAKKSKKPHKKVGKKLKSSSTNSAQQKDPIKQLAELPDTGDMNEIEGKHISKMQKMMALSEKNAMKEETEGEIQSPIKDLSTEQQQPDPINDLKNMQLKI